MRLAHPGEGPIVTKLLIVLALVVLSGMFSGAEIAVLALRRTRVDELIAAGGKRARAVKALRDDPERFLATVQIGITLIGTTVGVFSGASLAMHLVPLLEPLGHETAEEIALGVVVALVSALQIVVGELVPKSLALRAGESYALLVAPPLRFVATLARPIVWTLTALSNLVLRLFGDRTSFTEGRLSRDEIRQLVEEAASAGTVDSHVGEIATRALDLSDLDVASVMIPRPSIISIPIATPVDAIAELALTSGHARVPVHGDDLDDIRGYVNLREVLARADREPGLTLADTVRPVPFAPETMSAPAMLRELQRQRAHLAVVLDEIGTVTGLVTIEDLVEELVGEILSEHVRPAPGLRFEPDGSAVADAAMPLHELERALDLDLPEHESISTVGGLCLAIADRIPRPGERFEVPGLEIEILEATPRRIKLVRVRPLAPPDEGDDPR